MIEAPAKAEYFSHLREDVLSLVPQGVRTVLSVGCGGGRTEGELVKRGVEVYGIEMDAGAADAARERGIKIIEGDACDAGTLPDGVAFDCLIYADVLEHIADPVAVLAQHVPLLRDGGHVIISVPNFRNLMVFWQLFVRGKVSYADAGILDRTHLRLTTRRMVEEWLSDVGVVPVTARYHLARRRDRLLSRVTLGAATEFVARQVLILGQKRGVPR